MKRRDFIKTLTGGIAATTFLNCSITPQKPNIILIMADDLGYGDVGCYGNTWINTPNIDALAKGGMKFTDYHANGPICSPTRAALLTGRYQQRAGIEGVVSAANHRHAGMALEQITFAELLRQSGYRTAIFGKWHVGYSPEFNPVKQGFDEFRGYVSGNVDYQSHIDQAGYEDWWEQGKLVPENGYVTDLVSQAGADFIKRNQKNPFCLYLAHESPHYPYQGPDDPADRSVGQPKPTQGSRKDKKAAYKEMIESMDKGVGKIVAAVKNSGLEKDTFIFFCSDNGHTGPGSSGLLRGKKGTLWEGGTRVPGIANWPGKIKPGSQSDEMILSMDIFPTISKLAQAPISQDLELDGVNFSDVLLKGEKLRERTVFFRFKKFKVARKNQWKYLAEGEQEYLFDLENDLGERNNLAERYPNIFKELIEAFEIWEDNVTKDVEIVA
jgi:arylsulfatase A